MTTIQLEFTSNRASNTNLVDPTTGNLVYSVSTSTGLGKHTTTVRNARGEVVGIFEYGMLSQKVTLHGLRQDLNDWMPKKGRRHPL